MRKQGKDTGKRKRGDVVEKYHFIRALNYEEKELFSTMSLFMFNAKCDLRSAEAKGFQA